MKEESSWNQHSGPLVDQINNYKIIDCNMCKFKHAIPIPSHQELEEYYDKFYFDKRKPDYFQKQKKDEKWWNMVFSERYELFEKHIKTKNRRILDIGCGPGFFLKVGKELGWNTVGLEPSPKAAKFAQSQGLTVENCSFNSKNSKHLGKFDVVYMHGVLEHLPNPKETISLCYDLLNSGGILFTSVANDYNKLQMILKEYCEYSSWWAIPPEHINYFSKKSLESLLKSCRFKKLDMFSSFPMELFLLMGDNYIKNPEIGKKCQEKRKNLEFALKKGSSSLKNDLYRYFCQLGIGRQIDAICIKS
jgi:2-polyprenyl-3-methyl-5-hydroxy-6-metoxy-1,4-benzoquinol methylase